jgi:presenilin 1
LEISQFCHALWFLNLPDWTVWALLGLLVIYDACVVLCPNGLLNFFINKLEERGDQIPVFVYSVAVYFMGVSDDEGVQSLTLSDGETATDTRKKKGKRNR